MNHSGTLYVVATPIGNLQDITLRALDTLRSVDLIAAEDTRHSGHMLSHFGIQSKIMALHEHNERSAGKKLITLLEQGLSVALISDAGTPAISDPGALLVRLAEEAGIRVSPVPGANAAITALSVSGLLEQQFIFIGFMPAKAAQRKKVIESLREVSVTLIFYEAPHRILDSVAHLAEVLGGNRTITIARELTKTYETVHTCCLDEAPAWLQADPHRQRGEFVLLVEGAPPDDSNVASDEVYRILDTLLAELPLKQAVKLTATLTGSKKNAIYDLALNIKEKLN